MKKFLLNIRGVAVVEFALTVFFYFFVVFMIFELSRLALASAYWDLAIAQSSRMTKGQKQSEGNYEKIFKEELKKQRTLQSEANMVFFLQIPMSDDKVSVKYVDCSQGKNNNCIDALINEKFRQPKIDPKTGAILAPADGLSATLAVYTLTANYRFVVLPFIPRSWAEQTLTRRMITVQEYE